MSYLFTTNLGLVAVREEVPSAQDWAATYWNWINIDKLVYNMIHHHHTGVAALANPDAAPTLTTAATGGTLPGGRTYFGVVSYYDSFGRETGKSAAGTVTTAAAIAAPATPTHNFQATPTDLVADGGLATPVGLTGGDYWYKLTYVKGGGETTASDPVYVSVPTDDTYSATIHFESLNSVANGATSIYIYRKTGSSGSYVKLVEISAGATASYTDANLAVPTCDKQPPTVNTTNSFNTVTFDWSALAYTDAAYVNLYVTTTGTIGTPTFTQSTHRVTSIAVSLSTPVTSYTWTGTALTTGKPLNTSQSLTNPPKVILDSEVTGTLPIANLPDGIGGVTAYIATGVDWLAALPVAGEEGELAVVTNDTDGDSALFIWRANFATPMWHRLNPVLPSEPYGHSNPGYYWEPGTMWLYQPHFEKGYYLAVSTWDADVEYIPMSVSGIGIQMGWSDEGLSGFSYTTWPAPLQYDGHNGHSGTVGWDNNIKQFVYWDPSLATPAWVRGPGVITTGEIVEDVAESATPTAVELKINELLAVLRDSGIIDI